MSAGADIETERLRTGLGDDGAGLLEGSSAPCILDADGRIFNLQEIRRILPVVALVKRLVK